ISGLLRLISVFSRDSRSSPMCHRNGVSVSLHGLPHPADKGKTKSVITLQGFLVVGIPCCLLWTCHRHRSSSSSRRDDRGGGGTGRTCQWALRCCCAWPWCLLFFASSGTRPRERAPRMRWGCHVRSCAPNGCPPSPTSSTSSPAVAPRGLTRVAGHAEVIAKLGKTARLEMSQTECADVGVGRRCHVMGVGVGEGAASSAGPRRHSGIIWVPSTLISDPDDSQDMVGPASGHSPTRAAAR
ncbi:hypothetical protein BJV78DRAFT_1260978, partial [Lactifluus subvellereus]